MQSQLHPPYAPYSHQTERLASAHLLSIAFISWEKWAKRGYRGYSVLTQRSYPRSRGGWIFIADGFYVAMVVTMIKKGVVTVDLLGYGGNNDKEGCCYI